MDFAGSTFTTPEDINNSGAIVGVYDDVNNVHQGSVYSNGNFPTYKVPDATVTQIRGLNSLGDFVGLYVDAQNHVHGFRARPRGTVHYV